MAFFPVWQTRENKDKPSIESMNMGSHKSVQGFFESESACSFGIVVSNSNSVPSGICLYTNNFLFWYAVFILRICVTKKRSPIIFQIEFWTHQNKNTDSNRRS